MVSLGESAPLQALPACPGTTAVSARKCPACSRGLGQVGGHGVLRAVPEPLAVDKGPPPRGVGEGRLAQRLARQADERSDRPDGTDAGLVQGRRAPILGVVVADDPARPHRHGRPFPRREIDRAPETLFAPPGLLLYLPTIPP